MRFFYGLIHGKSALEAVDAADLLVLVDERLRKKIQSNLLEMYLDVYRVCKKYGIIPYLIGGSALGAVRHQGFIPWDIDTDISFLHNHSVSINKSMKRFSQAYQMFISRYYYLTNYEEINVFQKFLLKLVIQYGIFARRILYKI